MFLDYFYSFILYFANINFLFPFLIIGIFAINREKFLYLILIMLFTSVFNQFLKSVWQVPLNPELMLPGWGYPSGHTHMSVVFWLSLYMLFRRTWILITASVMLPLIMTGIVHFRFHDIGEVLGGLYFGISTVLVFHFIIKYTNNLKVFSLTILTLMCGIYLFLLPAVEKNYYHTLQYIFGILTAIIFCCFDKGKFLPADKGIGLFYAIGAIAFLTLFHTYGKFTDLDSFHAISSEYMRGILAGAGALILIPIIFNTLLRVKNIFLINMQNP